MEISSPLVMFLRRTWEGRQGISVHFNPFVLFLVFLVPLLLKLRNHITRGEKLRLPPNPPKLPFIGNLHQLGSLPHRSLRVLSEKYGPLMLLHFGHSPTVVVSSEKVAREMVRMHDVAFSNRPITTASYIISYGCNDVAFAPYGECWRQNRKVCVLELLSPRRVQSFHFVREEEVALMVDRIRQECLNGHPVDLGQILISVSNDIISRCVLGWKSKEENGKNSFADLIRNLAAQLAEFSVGDLFPSLRWMDVCSGLAARVKRTAKGFDALFDQIIEERKNNLKCDDKSQKKDLVQILLQLQHDERLDFQLTHEKLKALLMDMFAAGTETSFTLTQWAVSELIKNPTKMKKAQEEVRRIVGTTSKVDQDSIVQMEYLKYVIKETLRLHPPIPLLVPRETASRVILSGYDIPAKTRVMINAWAIQRDPESWDRAEEFLPERFENNPVDYKGQDFQFIPFGVGRRGCPGTLFGVATAEYMLANLLYWFDWKLPDDTPGEELDMTEMSGMTLAKKNPLLLVPVLYSA